ncbi:UNVERIFIED_CONTAM: septum formation inhibitor-activating ATPase MinD [Acetivibrio alkalicellulosi]
MRILLIAGRMHDIVKCYKSNEINIINDEFLFINNTIEYLDKIELLPQALLVNDEAFLEGNVNDFANLLGCLNEKGIKDIPIIFVTRNYYKVFELNDLKEKYRNIQIVVSHHLRIPVFLYKQIYRQLNEGTKLEAKKEKITTKKKTSFLDRFKSKPKPQKELEATDQLTKQLNNISRSLSKIVAVTGHRGSGVTSSVVNVASEAAKRGLSTIIVDLDIDYRSSNMYFSKFNEYTKKDEDINASLIKTLARPQDYITTAFNISENLWLTSLGYDFWDKKLINQFYNSIKLIGLLSVLRNKFNLIILDIPLDLFNNFKETLVHIDVFSLCVSNNLYSILSTLRNIEMVFDKENARYVNAKTKVLVTKYNDKSRFQGEIFTQDKVCEIISSGLSEYFVYEVTSGGSIPYSEDFDLQIERDVPLVYTGTDFEKAFGNILLRLMEGAK